MLDAFKVVKKSAKGLELVNKYPKFFDKKPNVPQKDGEFNFNDSLKQGQKKEIRAFVKQLSSDEE